MTTQRESRPDIIAAAPDLAEDHLHRNGLIASKNYKEIDEPRDPYYPDGWVG